MILILQTSWFLISTVQNNITFASLTQLNVKQCTDAPSNIQQANVRARVYVREKSKRIKAFKCDAYAQKERRISFQVSRKHRRVDGSVWNYNTMSLTVIFDPLEGKYL